MPPSGITSLKLRCPVSETRRCLSAAAAAGLCLGARASCPPRRKVAPLVGRERVEAARAASHLLRPRSSAHERRRNFVGVTAEGPAELATLGAAAPVGRARDPGSACSPRVAPAPSSTPSPAVAGRLLARTAARAGNAGALGRRDPAARAALGKAPMANRLVNLATAARPMSRLMPLACRSKAHAKGRALVVHSEAAGAIIFKPHPRLAERVTFNRRARLHWGYQVADQSRTITMRDICRLLAERAYLTAERWFDVVLFWDGAPLHPDALACAAPAPHRPGKNDRTYCLCAHIHSCARNQDFVDGVTDLDYHYHLLITTVQGAGAEPYPFHQWPTEQARFRARRDPEPAAFGSRRPRRRDHSSGPQPPPGIGSWRPQGRPQADQPCSRNLSRDTKEHRAEQRRQGAARREELQRGSKRSGIDGNPGPAVSAATRAEGPGDMRPASDSGAPAAPSAPATDHGGPVAQSGRQRRSPSPAAMPPPRRNASPHRRAAGAAPNFGGDETAAATDHAAPEPFDLPSGEASGGGGTGGARTRAMSPQAGRGRSWALRPRRVHSVLRLEVAQHLVRLALRRSWWDAFKGMQRKDSLLAASARVSFVPQALALLHDLIKNDLGSHAIAVLTGAVWSTAKYDKILNGSSSCPSPSRARPLRRRGAPTKSPPRRAFPADSISLPNVLRFGSTVSLAMLAHTVPAPAVSPALAWAFSRVFHERRGALRSGSLSLSAAKTRRASAT
ncbi:unnamed protein product, partial [Prorocentrum cordatum]